ncbi:adapter protein MecA 1/2 [Oikeobacillus pervagus]|uniref:Adapter protein MecA 1/2 n=1 Tax=Oikeobacillus pervagus TaxID=1325931 RepID=A0AAJ1WJ31_9BACI|nr:adaptor protein MecA [Oikeobacillus pervagus]MDQ0213721.1 adapter protein MecA 1/2 [Oikeobacillus pervagus]
MNIERLTCNSVKLFISFEELSEKGLFHERLLEDSFVFHQLFESLLDEIESKYDIQSDGAISIEIHSLTDDGVTFIFTLNENDVESDQELCVMHENLEGTESIYLFEQFDHLIYFIQDTSPNILNKLRASLYIKDYQYYLTVFFPSDAVRSIVEPLLLEYAKIANETIHLLKEYGKIIIEKQAFQKIRTYFVK